MAGGTVERRLAAILCADVVGYSRLMEGDEEATIRALSACRRIVDDMVERHRGRVFGSAGDSVVAEFASAVEAVRCAVEIQRLQGAQDADVSEDRRMRLRIGINLGDIVVEDSNLLGDGVNVAARLQALAEPGGLCISANIHEQVGGKLDLVFDDLGGQTVKNIARPIRAYRVRFETPIGHSDGSQRGPLGLPDKPSVAVLPFTNMSGEPEQGYFSDGITEDIITGLSRFRELFVIARNSAFTYKGRAVNVQDVGRELGVGYIVEGSVRKAGNRVRVTAQLIEAATGSHVWAERYDRELEDIFAVQDDITETVVATLAGRLGELGVDRVKRKPTESLTAFDYVLHARQLIYRYGQESIAEAKGLLERAIALDADYAAAHAWLAEAYWVEWWAGWTADDVCSYETSARHATQAVALDDTDGRAHIQVGQIHLYRRRYDDMRLSFDKAQSLNPNDPDAMMSRAFGSVYVGEPERALEQIDEAIRIDPLGHYGYIRGLASYGMRNYEDALAAFKTVRGEAQGVQAWLAACYGQIGNREDAKGASAEFVAVTTRLMGQVGARVPTIWTGYFTERHPYERADDQDHMLEGLRKAGLSA